MVRSKRIWAAAAILLCTGLVLALAPTGQKLPAKAAVKAVPVSVLDGAQGLQKASDKAKVGTAKVKPIVGQRDLGATQAAVPDAKIAAAEQAAAAQAAAEQAVVDGKKAADAQALEAEQAKAAELQPAEEYKPVVDEPLDPGLDLGTVDPGLGAVEVAGGESRAACAGEVVTGIGSGTARMYPLDAYYYYTRTMSLIKRSEIVGCDPSVIEKISIQITTAQTSAAMTNIEIRMYKTTATTVPTTWNGTGTLVYSAPSLQMTPVGWKEFDITDFTWDTDNLMITWQAQGPSVSGYPYYEYSSPGFPTGSYPQCYMSSDSSFGTTMTTVATRVLYKLKFPGSTPTGACCLGTGTCSIATQADCGTAYGTYAGNNTVCAPNPCVQPCNLTCNVADTPEGETCGGTSTNGGCNQTPNTFQPITCGTTICGTAWANAGTRDTDWYSFTLATPSLVAWTVTSEFPSANYIISGTCASPVISAAYGGNCTPVTVYAALNAGTYWAFVSTGTSAGAIYGGWPCSAVGNEYEATLTCTPYYCASYSTSTADETIKNVTLGTINNTTTDCDTYNYFGYLSTTLQAGFSYPLSVTIGDCENATCYSKRAVAYVDWNHDLVFNQATEKVWSSGQLTSTPCPDQVLSGSVAVPVTATLGPTIMRVIVVEGTNANDPNACGTYSYGATEDYTINVVAPPPVGACCDGSGGCTVVYAVNCLSPSVYKGDGTICTPNPCVGACCFPDGSCLLLTPAACTASYHGDGTVCGPNPCPQPGACCPLTGICYMSTAVGGNCAAGDLYKGDGTVCTPNPCPLPGACCSPLGVCYMSDFIAPGDCLAGDVYKGDGTVCTPTNPCPQPGACCFADASCSYLADWACAAAGGTFKGAGTTCANTLCPVLLFSFPMDTDPGWTTEGQWAFGQPLGAGGDPASGHTGLYVYGYNLAGQYAASIPAYNLTTPAFNFTGYMNIELRFWRWLGVESSTYDHARILVSTTGTEESWVELWSNPSTSIIETAWSFQSYTLPAQFNNQPAVYIRWVMGPVDTSVQYSGWNIDDVAIYGAVIPPVGACCTGATCAILSAYDCSQISGSYKGNGTVCSPNPCIGACCYLDGSCTLGLPSDCTGGTYHGDGTVCSPNPCPQPGMNCGNPFLLSLTPGFGTFTLSNHTTCGMGNDYADTCLGYYDGGEDTLYKITITADMCLTVTLDPQGTTYPGFALASTCPPGATGCIILMTESGSAVMTSPATALAAGVYYLMVDTWPSPTCIPAYNLTFAECPTGACCLGSVCTQNYGPQCVAAGGTYLGDLSTCSPNPCLTGACCVGTLGACQNSDEAGCVALSGVYHGGVTCATFTCPIEGNNCQLPIVVTLPAQLNYTDANQTTCGRGNDYADTCLGYYDGGEDIIYHLIVTEPICATFTATGNGSTNNWVGIAIDSACPPGATCLASANSSSGTVATISSLTLAAGTYSLMVDSWPPPNCLTSFTLTIVGCPRGACCLAGQPLGCAVMYQSVCTAAGGAFGGNGSACSGNDCNTNGTDDTCDILGGMADCNTNGILDVCEIAANPALDADLNGILDSCQPDCNTNGVPDSCEVAGGCATGNCYSYYPTYCGLLADCQPDGIPDICQLSKDRTNLVQDPSFEAGTTNPFWTATSTNYGTPLCDTAGCGTGGGTAAPRTGLIWAWFGGCGSTCTLPEVASLQQTIVIPSSPSATLELYLWIGAASGDGTDYFKVMMDGNVVFTALENNPTYAGGYTLVSVNVSSYANGGSHVLRLEGAQNTATATNFNVDDVSLTTGAAGGDCNHNGIPDFCDIRDHPELDCDGNGKIDTCEWVDCNNNGRLDACDISSGYSQDCNSNGIPDECEADCDHNGIPDSCDLATHPELDCNGNGVIDWCDINVFHTSQDCNHNGIPDECELYSKSRVVLQYDDGSSEDALGNASYEHEIYWIHHFATANPGTIQGIQTCFGYFGGTTPGVNAGDTFYVYVWSDANGDGQPSDAVLLGMASGSVAAGSIGTDVLQTVAMNVNVGTSFFIGASVHVLTGGYAAAMDTDVPAPGSQAWGGYKANTGTFVPIDPNTFATDTTTFFNAATEGFPANWMLRAQITFGAPPNDCNQNGIPDECDIQVAFGGFCPGTVYPPCDTDCNHNGKPDHCEKCGDLNGDGNVDQLDYWTMLDAFGRCTPDVRYTAAAAMDIDGDGCIGLADYQAWFCCYKTYAGKAFVPPPTPKPQAKTPTALQAQPVPVTPVAPAPKVR